MEEHLKSGNLSSEQHQTIVTQIDQLYKLQELKDKAERKSPQQEGSRGGSPQTVDKETLNTSKIIRDRSSVVPSSQSLPQNSNGFRKSSETSSFRGNLPPYHSRGPPPPHFDALPPKDRYLPPRQDYRGRGGFRPWRAPPPRRAPPRDWYPDGPPGPEMFQPRRAIPGPPPPRPLPQWHEPMDIDQG